MLKFRYSHAPKTAKLLTINIITYEKTEPPILLNCGHFLVHF